MMLGTNGFGKPTLIDALTNCIMRESMKGPITLNGEKLDGQFLEVISAYIM